jgi:Spy/CpxP family protein refolding chaperone
MKYKIFILAVLSLFVLSSFGFAKGQSPKHGQRGCNMEKPSHGCEMGFHKIPDLTEEQMTKIHELRVEHEKEILPLQAKVNSLWAELKVLALENNPNQQQINNKIDDIGKVKAQIQKTQIAHRLKVRELLTEKQKLHFNILPKHCGMHQKRGQHMMRDKH